MKIGVLALQGAVREHCNSLKVCGVEPVEIKYKEQLTEIKGLIIPGGESTTVGKLLVRHEMLGLLSEMGRKGFPIFGTCTGMIMLAREINGSEQPRLELMDITVERNAFGRQIASFETELVIPDLGSEKYPAVFIRAPYIINANNNVMVMAQLEGRILMARQEKLLAVAFHPELTSDYRVHEYFIKMCQ